MRLRPALVAFALIALAGCSGGGSKVTTPTPSPTPSVLDTAASEAAIIHAWEAFFNPAGTLQDHIALLENGSSFTAELTKSQTDPTAKYIVAKVTKVVVHGSSADVTYNLFGKAHVALLTGANGAAVLQDNTWKVSKFTYCQLISLEDTTVKHPACDS